MPKLKNPVVGARYAKLVILETFRDQSRSLYMCRCKCDCGKETVANRNHILYGITRSCGCLKIEAVIARNKKNAIHGISNTLIGMVWQAMIRRCFNIKDKSYHNYGARGIVPCEFIKASPLNLVLIMGEKPSPDHSVDRKNNDQGYNCGQCAQCIAHGWPLNLRWATAKEQTRSKRNNRLITINGVTKCHADWCIELGLSKYQVLKYAKAQQEQSPI